MAVLSDIFGVSYWTSLAQQLFLEVQASEGDDARGAASNIALYRILADRLDKKRDGHHRIDAAASLMPTSADVAWESWRAATARDSGSQRAALERLVAAIDDPRVAASCHLALARLKEHHLDDAEGGAQSLAAAAEAAPESRGVLWSSAFAALAAGDDDAVREILTWLASATEDPIWRATLELEVAAVARRTGYGPEEVSAHLGAALDQPGVGWTVAHEVMRTGAAIGDLELSERALTRIAEAALEQPPEPVPDRPAGHSFTAFKRGPQVAAAHHLLMAWAREREPGDPAGALEALTRAAELLQESPFLARERARLLEASSRFGDALAALPDSAPSSLRAELALASGQPALAAQLARTAAGESPSLLPLTIAEVAEIGHESAAETDVGTQDPTAWLMANPDHPDAPTVARDLLEGGHDLLLARLITAEHESPDRSWPPLDRITDGTAWNTALDAVTGPAKAQAATYERWAEQVTTPELKSLLVAAAARAAEDSEDNERALDLCQQALDLDPGHTESAERLVRVLRQLHKWSELADRIAELAEASSEPDAALAALHERAIVLEYALDDPSSATEALGELSTRAPQDVAAALSHARLALRAADWETAIERLGQLAELCPEDAPRLDLLRGELLLHALSRESAAAEHFDRAAEGLDGPLAQAARLHGIYCAYLSGETEPLDQRLQQEMLETADEMREMWLPEVLDTIRAARGAGAVSEMLDAGPTSTAMRRLWQVMVSAATEDPTAVARSLDELADTSPPGAIAGACRAAADLLDDTRPGAAAAPTDSDLESPEALWQAADRLAPDADAELRAGLFERRAELARERDPLEWADWMLDRADALAESGDAQTALEAVEAALGGLPEHPGLLEAKVELCLELERYEAAVDSCTRIARFFTADDEKATQLSRAATILYEKLGEDAGAEKLVREAIRRSPGHEIANEVLTRILNARGDDEALVDQIEARIEAEYDTEALVSLYQEQADRLFAVDNLTGALDAIENLLLLAPEDHGAHRTKIDILLSSEDWPASFQAMREFIEALEDGDERRSMIWRAAELRAEHLEEVDEALEMLAELIEQGDDHPQTLRYVAHIARKGSRWEKLAEALSRLADLLDRDKRLEVLREEAEVRLENLFDPEEAAAVVDRALAIHPSDLELIKFAEDFREPEATRRALARAEADLRAKLAAEPIDWARITLLEEVARLLGKGDVSTQCGAVLKVLAGTEAPSHKTERLLRGATEPARVRQLLIHPDEQASATFRVAALGAGMAKAVFGKGEAFPETGRSTLVGKRSDDPVRAWLKQLADALGIDPFEMHRAGADPRGSMTLPGEPPAVAVAPEMTDAYDAVQRFYLARHLWRSAQGLGAFQEGDTAGPVRWIMALMMAALGDEARPPLPTDRDLVTQARKAMPRKVRKALAEPGAALAQETPKAIRAWLHAASYTADRVGLLAAGDLSAVIRPLIEESAGPAGLRRFDEQPEKTLTKVPRGVELVRFALSEAYLELELILGFAGGGAP